MGNSPQVSRAPEGADTINSNAFHLGKSGASEFGCADFCSGLAGTSCALPEMGKPVFSKLADFEMEAFPGFRGGAGSDVTMVPASDEEEGHAALAAHSSGTMSPLDCVVQNSVQMGQSQKPMFRQCCFQTLRMGW